MLFLRWRAASTKAGTKDDLLLDEVGGGGVEEEETRGGVGVWEEMEVRQLAVEEGEGTAALVPTGRD